MKFRKSFGAKQGDMGPVLFWVLLVVLIAGRLVLASCQDVYVWIDGAPLDDELMFRAAQSITAGNWLGAYDYLTLSKQMFFAVWLAFLHLLGVPYLMGGQLLMCGAALAAAFALAPVLPRRWMRLAVFGLLAYSPAAAASFTLRVYRDNIFPALCLYAFAGFIGVALRCAGPVRRQLGWLVMAGLGMGLAWITREDGMWLLPFAVVAVIATAVAVLRLPGLARRGGRVAVLAVPFALTAVCVNLICLLNWQHYRLWATSDFSTGAFAEAFGAMTRVTHEDWDPLVAVPADVREKLYDQVPELAQLEYWLEEDEKFRDAWIGRPDGDYQTGGFYWALRRAAQYEGWYETPQTAAEHWQAVADRINELCDSGQLPCDLPRRSSTTAPIRAEYVGPVLAEGLHSFWYAATFQDCAPYYADQRSLGQPEDLAVYHEYLGCTTNDAAQAGTDLPYYHPLRMLVYKAFEALRLLYAVALPLALAAALARQLYLGWGMLRRRSADGLLLWLALAGVLAMALLRCFMIAFVEVSSFNIGTYVMYLSTVHPLLLLYAAGGLLTRKEAAACRS